MEMLVARLDDDDDAVRFFAILALERMTGTRMGYSYHTRADQRLRAVQTWRRYLQQEAAQAGGAGGLITPGDVETTVDPGGATHAHAEKVGGEP
jgi:hypothetical protein